MRRWDAIGMSSKPTTDTSPGTGLAVALQPIDQRDRDHVVGAADGGGRRRQCGTGSRPRARKRGGERVGAAVDRLLVRARVREGDPPVAEAGEVLDHLLHRGVLVDVDRAQARVAALERDDDDRHAAVEQLRRDGRSRGHGGEDDPVDAPADQRPHLGGLGGRVVLGLGDEHREAVAVGTPLDLQGDRGVERVQRVGDDDPEGARRAPLERPGDLVLAVAELVDRLEHPAPGRLGHGRRRVQDVRDGGHRDTGSACDVVHGHRHPTGTSASASAARSAASERLDALLGTHARVLVLDRDVAVIAGRAQGAEELGPALDAAAGRRRRRSATRPRPGRPGGGSRSGRGGGRGRDGSACPCRGRSRCGRRRPR